MVTQAFQFAETIADLKLTESELALFSAYVLISPGRDGRRVSVIKSDPCLVPLPDRSGLKGILEIQRLNQALLKALRFELGKSHRAYHVKGDVTLLDMLLTKTGALRELSMLHMEALAKFRRSAPHLDFPALHKELFSVDI